MNDKFKMLALQATIGKAEFDNGSYYVATPDKMQKFAELIVRECMRMCDCAEASLLEHSYPRESDGAASVKQFIAEHFGVEE